MKTSESHPIIVNFIEAPDFPILRNLGMTFAPGKIQAGAWTGDWNRDLMADLGRLKEFYDTDILISLVEGVELAELQITGLVGACKLLGIELIRFPIPDASVPTSIEAFKTLVNVAVTKLADGKKVVVHCKGGLGRAGTVTACIALEATRMNLSPDRVIELVRNTRPGTIENSAQEAFVRSFNEIRDDRTK